MDIWEISLRVLELEPQDYHHSGGTSFTDLIIMYSWKILTFHCFCSVNGCYLVDGDHLHRPFLFLCRNRLCVFRVEHTYLFVKQ